jgi:hypothetical protein
MSTFTISAFAPSLKIGQMSINDITGGNGNGRLDPGETAVLHVQFTNTGHSDAFNTTGTLISDNSNLQVTNPVFTIGNLLHGAAGEEIFTVTVGGTTPIGTNVGLTNILSSGPYADTALFTPVVGQIDEDFETSDFHKFTWVHGGNLPWTISTDLPFEGSNCAISGAITNSQTSELSINFEVVNADSISFFHKVSSESDYDYLRFYIDNTTAGEWSGVQNWSRSSYPVTAGVHTFRWTYEKDVSLAEGADAGWIDYIVFPPVALFTTIDKEAATFSFGIYPNPTTGNLAVNYHLASTAIVTLTLCDASGRELMTLAPALEKAAGNYTETSDVSSVKSGIYFIKMQAGSSSLIRKVIVR